MRPARMRILLLGIAALGVAGMIATSVADSVDGALVFGMLTLGAAFALVCVTAVTDGGRARPDDELAADVEDGVADLVEAGADERAVRRLVRDAVHLGRAAAGGSDAGPTGAG